METENSNSNFHTLLEAIKSSDVVECRVQLLLKLSELNLPEKSDVALLVQSLTTFLEDFTCLDVSQCLLNKAILQLAAKYVDSDLSECLLQFLDLVTKGSIWCGKHLKMTLMSTEDSQEEEHCDIFFQVLLDFLSLSAASLVAIIRYPVATDNDSAVVVERFILEQLNLTRDVVSDAKRTNCSSEVLRAAQMVIDAVIRLCKERFLAVNWDSCDARPKKEENIIDDKVENSRNHVINITKCTIEKLYKLGILAANDGGSLVSILNISWKSVVTLLQQGKEVLMERVCVQDIIVTLISLVKEPLRCAAMAWSSLEETISVTEARRTFLPVKFYLINAVKISSLYPCQAYLIYRELTLCALMISTFRILLSREKLLNTASEVFSELLEKTSMELLTSILNSAEVRQEQKFELLDWLFTDGCFSNSSLDDSSSSFCHIASMVEILSSSSESMPRQRVLLLGRIALYHTFLRYSVFLEEDVRNKITRKLGWLLDTLVDEEVYSCILDLQIPVPYGSGKTSELVWQPIFSSVLDAIKTFMILVSSSDGWVELEDFLLENLFHPHFLCWEMITELWCFLLRHAEADMVNGILDKFLSLMMQLASPESVLFPASPLRKLARTVCLLLKNGSSSMVDYVYSSVDGDEKSQWSSVTCLALLMEGFPLNSMSDNLRSTAKQKIVTNYFSFVGTSSNKPSTACSSSVLGIPVFILSASLQSQQVCISDVDMKSLNLLLTTIRNFRNAVDKIMKEHYHKLLSETLEVISNIKHLYKSDEMEEVVLELQNLFISGPAASDPLLYQCKPYLAFFMGGLGDMEMSENDDCSKSCAVWELYHMLFKERHWALVHLAISAFGYFAARTSCNKLWRFVPQNAALSYDLMSGNEANEERFMSELKAFLEKEIAVLTISPSFEQLELLVKEGMVLKEIVRSFSSIQVEAMECEELDTDIQSNKRRKLPDEISEGVELLQSGLKVIGDSLSQWRQNHFESSEYHDKFLAHFSQLQDAITHIIGLTGE